MGTKSLQAGNNIVSLASPPLHLLRFPIQITAADLTYSQYTAVDRALGTAMPIIAWAMQTLRRRQESSGGNSDSHAHSHFHFGYWCWKQLAGVSGTEMHSEFFHGPMGGTEVSLLAAEDMDLLLAEIACFLKKMLILQRNNIVIELVAEVGDCTQSCHNFVRASVPQSLPFAVASNIDNLTTGLEDYLHKHRNQLTEVCEFCAKYENLKVGKGVSCKEYNINDGLVAEAVIIIRELSGACPSCLSTCDSKTEVDSIFPKIGISTPRQGIQLERNLIKKSVKLALDDMKKNYAGTLLSAHAHKITSYAPDLARSIAGLIFCSNDHAFQEECFSLLGLRPDTVAAEVVENCIKEKIVSAIEIDDRKPRGCRNSAPSLFHDYSHSPDDQFLVQMGKMRS
ncbi:Type 2 DNA topoisomerase 6 subunit B-like-like protein [Drosera capensis]